MPKNAAEQQRGRRGINSSVAFDEVHKDPFLHIDPSPSKELREKLNNLLGQGRTKIGLVINFLEQLVPNDPSLSSIARDDTQLLFNQIQNWASDLNIRRHKHVVLLITHNVRLTYTRISP